MSFPASAVLFPQNTGGIEINPSSSATSGVRDSGISFGNSGAGSSNSQVFIVAAAVLAGLYIWRKVK